jgi:hypothetical protein
VDVSGHAPVRVELYLARGAEPAIQVACAGTLVADDIAQLEALGLVQAPWVGRDVVGLVDFAGFHVPPGTRRGVMPDAAASAFADAMERLAPLVDAELARLDEERRAALDRDVVPDLKRALRGFARRLPRRAERTPRTCSSNWSRCWRTPRGTCAAREVDAALARAAHSYQESLPWARRRSASA